MEWRDVWGLYEHFSSGYFSRESIEKWLTANNICSSPSVYYWQICIGASSLKTFSGHVIVAVMNIYSLKECENFDVKFMHV